MAKKEKHEEMSLEEAKEWRASLHKPKERKLTDQEKKEKFRLFWAKSKKKYASKTQNIEKILWLHLVSTNHDEPEKFEKGLENFGLKRV